MPICTTHVHTAAHSSGTVSAHALGVLYCRANEPLAVEEASGDTRNPVKYPMASPAHMSIGEMLKRYRVRARLTQEELAERAGLSARGISDLERGLSQRPRRETLYLLAEALKLSAAELGALEQSTRQATPSARAAAPASGTGAVSAEPLVGRQAELALIERTLAGGGAPVLMLAGEPGIGKSRLLEEAAQRAEERGMLVLRGGCRAGGTRELYGPLVETLSQAIAVLKQVERRRALLGCSWLVRLLPELADLGLVPVPSWTLEEEQERRLMFTAASRFLRNVAPPDGIAVILDDLQWASGDALEFLDALVRDTQGVLRVVAGYGDTEAPAAGPLGTLLSAWVRGRRAERLALKPLTQDETRDLLATLLPSEALGDETIVAGLARRSGGVPLFAKGLATAVCEGLTASLSWDVAETIRQRMVRLPEATRTLLALAAVIGRVSERGALLEACALREDEALDALDAACHAGLLTEVGEDGYAFTHDLVAEVIARDLGSARRAGLHRRVAEALGRESGEAPVGQLAYHFAQAGDQRQAAIYYERAGDRARLLHAPAAAETEYRAAIVRLDILGERLSSARVREKLARELQAVGRPATAVIELERAAATFRSADDMNGFARVLAVLGEAHADDVTAQAGLERLLSEQDALVGSHVSPGVMALYWSAVALLYRRLQQYDRQAATAEVAQRLAEQAGEAAVARRAALRRANALVLLSRLDEAAQVLEALLPEVSAARDARDLWSVLDNQSYIALVQGRLNEAASYVRRALDVAEQVGETPSLAYLHVQRAYLAYYQGEWACADEHLAAAASLLDSTASSSYDWWPVTLGAQIALARGEDNPALTQIEQVIAVGRDRADIQAQRTGLLARAEHDLLHGECEALRGRMEAVLDRPGQQEQDVTALLPLLAWAHLEAGDLVRAECVILEALERMRATSDTIDRAEALVVQARLETRRGRWSEADVATAEALRLARQIGLPYSEVKALWVAGELARARGDHATARERLSQALAICRRLGERLYFGVIQRGMTTLD